MAIYAIQVQAKEFLAECDVLAPVQVDCCVDTDAGSIPEWVCRKEFGDGHSRKDHFKGKAAHDKPSPCGEQQLLEAKECAQSPYPPRTKDQCLIANDCKFSAQEDVPSNFPRTYEAILTMMTEKNEAEAKFTASQTALDVERKEFQRKIDELQEIHSNALEAATEAKVQYQAELESTFGKLKAKLKAISELAENHLGTGSEAVTLTDLQEVVVQVETELQEEIEKLLDENVACLEAQETLKREIAQLKEECRQTMFQMQAKLTELHQKQVEKVAKGANDNLNDLLTRNLEVSTTT